jgi:hypothetical protein
LGHAKGSTTAFSARQGALLRNLYRGSCTRGATGYVPQDDGAGRHAAARAVRGDTRPRNGGIPVIKEQEVRDVLALYPDGFIRRYCAFAEQQVSSHLGYHLATALCMAAVASPTNLIGVGFKAPTRVNLYGIIVGSSGDAEKTLAINVGLRILSESVPALLGPDPTAEETLSKILSTRPSQLFVYPELAMFLSKTAGGTANQRGSSLRDGFMGTFDGFSYTREYSKGQQVEVLNPRVSFLGACTPRHLEDYTIALDWEGGFLNRFFIMYGERERDISSPTPDPAVEAWLRGYLTWSGGCEAAECLGLTPEAEACWTTWKKEFFLKHQAIHKDERVKGLVARSRLIAAKVATLLSWTLGRGTTPWRIEEDVMQAAVATAELHLRSALALVVRIAPNHEMREQGAVLRACGEGEWRALGDILRDCYLPMRKAKIYIDTLLEMGVLTTCVQDVTAYYRVVQNGAPRPYDGSVANLPPPPPLPGHASKSSSSTQEGTSASSEASAEDAFEVDPRFASWDPTAWAPPPPPAL